jgi:hypothetical protein
MIIFRYSSQMLPLQPLQAMLAKSGTRYLFTAIRYALKLLSRMLGSAMFSNQCCSQDSTVQYWPDRRT